MPGEAPSAHAWATIIFAAAETGGGKGPVLMKPVFLGGWVQSQPQMEARPPAGIVPHSCGCSSSPVLTAAWPLASEATDVFACLCPLMSWAKAISGQHVLQTDQQSRKYPFSLPQLDGWGGGVGECQPLPSASSTHISGARGSHGGAQLQSCVWSHLRAGVGAC